MSEPLKYLIDAAAAVGLFFALLIVFAVDWLTSGTRANTLTNVEVRPASTQTKKLKLAVVKTHEGMNQLTQRREKWDDMGKLLRKLGEGYPFDDLDVLDVVKLHETNKLKEYDVVFLTCNQPNHDDLLRDPIQKYVEGGGILYASDWRYTAIAKAFPELVNKQTADAGVAQKVNADIVDPALREALKENSIRLDFNLDQWRTAAFSGPGVEVLMKGAYRPVRGEMRTAPLMVRFPFGNNNGKVIFTSFHNESQNSDLEVKLLQYLVFSLVTESIEAELNASSAKEGFESRGSNLLSTQAKKDEPRIYDNPRVCTLRFALGYRGERYKLRFTIESPSGKIFSHVCEGTTTLEVTEAEKGKWKYSVENINAPDNLAFRMIVVEKR